MCLAKTVGSGVVLSYDDNDVHNCECVFNDDSCSRKMTAVLSCESFYGTFCISRGGVHSSQVPPRSPSPEGHLSAIELASSSCRLTVTNLLLASLSESLPYLTSQLGSCLELGSCDLFTGLASKELSSINSLLGPVHVKRGHASVVNGSQPKPSLKLHLSTIGTIPGQQLFG
jgi:hypothetical protein